MRRVEEEEAVLRRRYRLTLGGLLALLLAAVLLSFGVGYYPLSPGQVAAAFLSGLGLAEVPPQASAVFWSFRLPRILSAALIGASLSVAGAAYQGMFRNPLVSPDILGVSSGASLGAAAAILGGAGGGGVQLAAFLGGGAAVAASCLISRRSAHPRALSLVLVGSMMMALCNAGVTLIKYVGDPDDVLQQITFWLMGSLGRVDNDDIRLMVPLALASLILLFIFRNQIDTMASGEQEAATMGVNVPLVKAVVVLASTLMTVVSVSMCGIIGWVGMVVPHIARALVGASYGRLVSVSFFIGGIVLLVVDNMIRGTMAVDLPLGVLTSLMGTPVFVLLLAKSGKEWH